MGHTIQNSFLICLMSGSVLAATTSEQIRTATAGYIQNGREDEGIEKITGYLSRQVSSKARVPSRELPALVVAAECVQFMRLSEQLKLSDEIAAWILDSEERLRGLVGTINPHDEKEQCIEVIKKLYQHDPEERDGFYNLILAIAMVMDQSGNNRMHRQMGEELLTYEPDPIVRYDYFKKLYSGKQAKIDYASLGISELIFVVHTPVPIEELEWARGHTDGSLSDWGEKYRSIEYNDTRIDESRYTWDQGTYTLERIQNLGGICVDQAYFAVMTGRAYGIPAIYFRGSGKSSGHAWFGYMKAPGEWVLNEGRYKNSAFTTGFAINPQTHREMTDHDVGYTCERSLHSEKGTRAGWYTTIAEVLLEHDPKSALRCARIARDWSKRSMRPWEIEEELLAKKKDYRGLTELFSDQKDAFRKYPDILVASAGRIEAILREAGKNTEADRLLKSMASAMKDDRDDITRSLEMQRIEKILAGGNAKKARKEIEQMLDDQKDQGNKILGHIHAYLKITKESGQTHEAAKFLGKYIDHLLQKYNFSPVYQKRVLNMLLTAYENDGDTKKANKIKERIERLEYL